MTSARSSKRTPTSESVRRPDDYEDGSGGSGRGGARNADRGVGGGAAADRSGGDGPGLGARGYLRWFWRQLTSMRVALILLLLLAVAAIPGSLLPQRGADPNGVVQYEADHPELFKILDAFPIQAFDVYSSVWFSAIYLLLFISLIGCVLPRIAHHWRALRSAPPRTPARLARMVGFSELHISNPEADAAASEEFAAGAIDEARELLRAQHYRAEVQRVTTRSGQLEISVSAERGYLRETGNLLFHIALVGVLISVAIGGLFNFNGQKVLVEGETMVNQLIDYDSATSGRWFDSSALDPYRMRLDDLEVDYVTPESGNAGAVGLATNFTAYVSVIDGADGETHETIRVNHPLRVLDSPVYLIANGYAPTLTVRNASGTIVFSESVPFIPQDQNLTSLGVVKVPFGIDLDGEPTQLGLQGFFYPTAGQLATGALTSTYPDLENPQLTLNVWAGDLGIDEGIPQSVYALDTSAMEPLASRELDDSKPLELTIGETVELPEGMGTITFEAAPRYASFDVMHNPAQEWILVFALLAVGGLLLSLFVPRRRLWVKALPAAGGVQLQYAGLARGDDPTLEQAVEQLRERHRERL